MDFYKILDNILDSNDVTVGGGSSAAISGAMAAGLIGMVSLLSRGKDYGLDDNEYEDIERTTVSLKNKLLDGCVQDALAYNGIVLAYKLPKSTDEEKAARSAAIQEAGRLAAATPRDNANFCAEVYKMGISIQDKSNKNAASDLQFGIGLAKLGVQGCIANIEANLSLIKNESIKDEFLNDIAKLKACVE